MWNYWNYCCGIVFVTGIKTTICCGMEWLVSFGGAYEPVGQGFESLPARQNKNPFSKECGFLFCIIHFSLFNIHYSLKTDF